MVSLVEKARSSDLTSKFCKFLIDNLLARALPIETSISVVVDFLFVGVEMTMSS